MVTRAELIAVMTELLDALPDGPHYAWVWDECLSHEQEYVKRVREQAREVLARLEAEGVE